MSYKINSGLFKLDFIDHHAVLGVPLDADFKDIRKRYLQIARRLHPDSCAAKSTADQQLASELFSKLVNPAYEKFSTERTRAEYTVVLKEISKRLLQESSTIQLQSELAQQLNQTNNIEHIYKTSLAKLTASQYDSFDQILQLIGQISELNLVYLMRKGGNMFQVVQPGQAPSQTSTPKASVPIPTASSPPAAQPETIVEQYYRRALALAEKNNFPLARVELQDALKLEPNNSSCHSLMGVIYLKQNQITMAKVYINKALQLNPQEPMAVKAKQFLDQTSQKAVAQQSTASKTTAAKQTGSKSDASKGGGIFGGLFGGKKK